MVNSYKTIKKKPQNWDEKFKWSYVKYFVVKSHFSRISSAKNIKFAYSEIFSMLNLTAAYLV